MFGKRRKRTTVISARASNLTEETLAFFEADQDGAGLDASLPLL
jgi:hypothetical protein